MSFAIAASDRRENSALVRLADTFQLGVEQLDLALVKIGREALRDGLSGLLHAGIFGRSDLIEGHALCLELGQRLLGLNAGLLALIITRLSHSLAHQLLLFRRELVPKLLAD